MRKLLTGTIVMWAALGCGTALAHEGAVGEGSDIVAVTDVELGHGIEATWGNGEIDLHIPVGVSVVVYGVSGEEMLKADESGTSFANKQSVTWLANTGETPVVSDDAEPEWEQIGTGGLRFHDHRIHFMSSIPENASKGDTLQEWSIPMSVNGEKIDVTGRLVLNVEPAGGSGPVFVWVFVALIVGAGGSWLALRRNRD